MVWKKKKGQRDKGQNQSRGENDEPQGASLKDPVKPTLSTLVFELLSL